jgi:hypothetical protein
MQPTAKKQVQFLLKIGRLLQDGSFVATYKHALLLSIAGVCVEKGNDSGGKLQVRVDDLAEKFILYYWRQAIPYQPLGRQQAGTILRQNKGKQRRSLLLSRVQELSTEARLSS